MSDYVGSVDDLMNYLEAKFISDRVIPQDIQTYLPKEDTIVMGDMNTPSESSEVGRSYLYLNDYILSNDLGFKREYTTPYKLHLCLFTMNQELPTPFLKYMFVLENGVYQFPMADIESGEMVRIQETAVSEDIDEDDAISDEFLKQCSQLLTKYVVMDNQTVNEIYRGYLEDDEYNIYAFFDVNNMQLQMDVDYALITDILSGSLLGKPMNTSCINIFKLNPFTLDVKDTDGYIVPRPISAYACRKSANEEYENIYYDEADRSANKTTVLIEQVSHDMYGSIFLFTMKPITGVYENIQRFALFNEGIHDEDDEDTETAHSDDMEDVSEEEEVEVDEAEEEEEDEAEEEEDEEETESTEVEEAEEEEDEDEAEEEEDAEETESAEAEEEAAEGETVETEDDDESMNDSMDDGLCFTENGIEFCGVYTIDIFVEI
jgi:hypothetical protein